MNNATWLLTLYCAVILAASMAGGWLPLVRRPSHLMLQTYLSFASGIMLGAAMCHMLPEASQLAAGSWFYWTLGGLLGVFFLERFFEFHHHEVPPPADDLSHAHEHDHDCVEQKPHVHEAAHAGGRLAWGATLVGLTVHTLTGGFALASAVAADAGASVWLGSSVFLATALHKPADSLTITSLMISEGAKRRTAHLVNFAFALVIPLGVLLYYIVRRLAISRGSGFAGGALAFSAGTFLSIALGDLMPELQFHRHDRLRLSLALVAGVAVMFASAWLEK